MAITKDALPYCSIGEKRFLTTEEACAYVSISRDTLDEWCRQGLPRSKLGTTRASLVRYDKLEIDRFLELQSDRLDEDDRERLLKRRNR